MTRKRRPKTEALTDRDLRPDGWSRFEKAVDAALRTKPKHRPAAKPQPKAKRQHAEHRV
jgi:hypothetical protein